jgi:hypothetical protein
VAGEGGVVKGFSQTLLAQLERYDDEAYVALANRGLLRRALKDLESLHAILIEDAANYTVVGIGEHRIRFDAAGPAAAKCSCPATAVCQHILAAAVGLTRLQKLNVAEISNEPVSAANNDVEVTAPDSVAELHELLMAIPPAALLKQAGKAGYRWAWQYVQDLDIEEDVSISGERHIVISFRQPRLTLRYMGGGAGNMLVDVQSAQLAKQQVAAVLAYWRVHGIEAQAPEAAARPKNEALELGKDHEIAETPADSQVTSRHRLRGSVKQLLEDCVELGVSHLSQNIHERFSTLAVWAQGAEYYRLALMLRRIADHVEMMLERAGGADSQRLFDEMTLAYGLVTALEVAAGKGAAPSHLLGRARSRYDKVGTLTLLGLGAQAWRAASGYIGLTMLFWSPEDKVFYSCADARPEMQRGFNPVARYRANGPWAGLGSPADATGHQVQLVGVQVNAQGRLSASEATMAKVQAGENFADQLLQYTRWSTLERARSEARRSLLSEPDPMRDWVVLKPHKWGAAQFSGIRQLLEWPLFDEEGTRLDIELVYSEYAEHAIGRIEQLDREGVPAGSLLVARIRSTADGLVGEPLSIIRPNPKPGENPVDALYFDSVPRENMLSRWKSRFRVKTEAATAENALGNAGADNRHIILADFKQWLQRQAERGYAEDRLIPVLREFSAEAERMTASGYSLFRVIAELEGAFAALLLQSNYILMQYERLLDGSQASQIEQ